MKEMTQLEAYIAFVMEDLMDFRRFIKSLYMSNFFSLFMRIDNALSH